MSTLFEDLKTGLAEAIDFEKGNSSAKITIYSIDPVREYTNKEIKRIRNKAGMTQSVFASYLGVSPKTVEAWELGRTHPTGPANRLIGILDDGKESILPFVTVTNTPT